MNNVTTTNIAQFGWRERKLAAELLLASCEQGFPDDFYDDGVEIMFNTHSGNVFFTNSEFQVCMMNGSELEMWYSTPYSGHEGFAEDLRDKLDETWNAEDVEYLRNTGIIDEDVYDEWFGNTEEDSDED